MENSIVDRLLSDAGLKPTEVRTKIRARVLRIGPDEAAALLKANSKNRKIRPGRVSFYANTIRGGGWKLTHQGIAFNTAGVGVDLQHRLTAVIESGMSIDIMVTENLPEDSFDAIDQHERRAMHDALGTDRGVTEVAKMFIRLLGGANATNPTLLRVGEVSGQIEALHEKLMEACNRRRKVYSSVGIRAAAILVMMENPSLTDWVCNTYRLLTSMRTEEWTPVMHAFGRQVSSGHATSDSRNRLDLFLRALVVFDKDKSGLSKIQMSSVSVDAARERAERVFDEDADDGTEGCYTLFN